MGGGGECHTSNEIKETKLGKLKFKRDIWPE